jgi:hypothetical protein
MSLQYDLKYLDEISAGDKDFIIDMLHDFVVNTPETLKELKVYIDASNYDEIYKVVHRFIPTYEYVGAEKIKDNLREIEAFTKQNTNIDKICLLYYDVYSESIELCKLIATDYKIEV